MQVTHLQSATQIIHLGDIKVLTDPWLTPGEYYGSWYHYPPFPEEGLAELDYDYIYVSHIHPDHLSEATFKALPRKVPVLIHNYDSKFVKRKIEMFGFEAIECDHAVPFSFANGATLTILAADNCDPALCSKFLGCAMVETKFGSTQIDSLAVFEHEGRVIVNTNDCPFELAETTLRANGLTDKAVDLLLVGYGGAGPYPQCFVFDSEEDRVVAAKKKEQQFLDQALKYIRLIEPRAFVPFAGTYILGSRLAPLTAFRGVADIHSAVEYLDAEVGTLSTGVLLEQFDVLDAHTLSKVSGARACESSYEDYVRMIAEKPLSYDDDQWDDEEIPALVAAASERFQARADTIGFSSLTRLIIASDKTAFALRVGKPTEFIDENDLGNGPFLKLTVNHNLLHRLLRGPRYAHWNNAEIGSHLRYQRWPDIYERGLYHCLCFLHQ